MTLGEDLAKEGAEVSAVAGTGGLALLGGERPARKGRWLGVVIRRIPWTDFDRRGVVGRVTDCAAFLISAGVYLAVGGQGKAEKEKRRKEDKVQRRGEVEC